MFHRIFVTLLAAAGILSASAATDIWDGTMQRPQDVGHGSTADDPILITSAEEFAFLICKYDNKNNICAFRHYRLTCDLDMGGIPWTYGVQHEDNHSWRAHFDGAGHRITGVYIPVQPSTLDAQVGLFPRVGGDPEHEALIENLEVDSIIVEQVTALGIPVPGTRSVGRMVGKDFGYARIVNCNEGSNTRHAVPLRIDGSRSAEGRYTVVPSPAQGVAPAAYRWHLEGKELKAFTAAECTVHPDIITRTLSVEALDAAGAVLGSAAVTVEAVPLELVVTDVRESGSTFNISAEVFGPGAETLSDDFLYSWYEIEPGNIHTTTAGTSRTLTGARPGCTYHLVARHRRYKNCILGAYHTFRRPVYVSLHGTASEAARYSFDGTAYPAGNDANDGSAPEKAVRTLRRAYELLTPASEGADAWSNIVVIMGDYDQDIFNTHLDEQQRQPNPEWFLKDRPATIVGQYGNIRGGRLQLSGDNLCLDADTRFDCIELHGNPTVADGDYAHLYAQHNDLWMGDGIKVTGYSSLTGSRGLTSGCRAPNVSIFGGYLNNDDPRRPRRANRLIFYSGYWGRIIAGDRNTRLNARSGNVAGSPHAPLRSYIRIETANNENPDHYTHDVALLVGGQGDGSCYALDTIEVFSPSRIGRVIGGNIGYGRPTYVQQGERRQDRPSDSFFGQIYITMKGGEIGELYGASLGRHGHLLHHDDVIMDSCATYFYGRVHIDISGGTMVGTVYGGGAGGVTGLGSDRYHTYDPLIPYTLSNGAIEYGAYDRAVGKLPRVIVSDSTSIDLNRTEVRVDVGGTALMLGSVYGGGYGYSNQLLTRNMVMQGGSVFGDIHVNVGGNARLEGYIFGGGRGTNYYYDDLDGTGFPDRGATSDRSLFSRLACVYGQTYLTVNGGTVRGCVYGAGEGTAYRATSPDDPTNATHDMASVFGSTHIYIRGGDLKEFIFGGGNYGNVRKAGIEGDDKDGSTFIHIEGGRLWNSVFGGGHGRINTAYPEQTVSADIMGHTWVYLRGGEFRHTAEPSVYDAYRFYGVYGSGRSASTVFGDTHVDATCSLFSDEFLKAAGLDHWNDENRRDRRYALSGGGFGDQSCVRGDTYVNVHFDDGKTQPITPAQFAAGIPAKQPVPHLSFIDVMGGGVDGIVYGSTNVTFSGRGYARNIYGGSLMGVVGGRDVALNGNLDSPDDSERAYTTRATVNFLSGSVRNIYGGSFMGDVVCETFVNIGQLGDSASNRDCHPYHIYGGNNVSGTVAGSNNDRYGTNINIMGGTVHGDVYGSGNGDLGDNVKPDPSLPKDALQNMLVDRQRPHVASVRIRLAGTSKEDRTRVLGAVYGGGNNTTVGIFVPDTERQSLTSTWGLRRELMVPNRGHLRINIGNHVDVGDLFMGCNGRALDNYIPYVTADGGETWHQGFLSDADFTEFCRSVDVSCMPALTFNADNSFSNQHLVIDWFGDRKEIETPGEMDAEDVTIRRFFGGSYRGSMTSDSICVYTLPPGLTIRESIVGGCANSYIRYTEQAGPDAGKERLRIGGFIPYHEDTKEYHRLQLNIFCQFEPVRRIEDPVTRQLRYEGATIFGGCYDHGLIVGATSINFHSNLVGDYDMVESGSELFQAASLFTTDCAQIYGGGMGKETEIIGSTYVTMSGARFNGIKCIPSLFNAFGGGMMGSIVGRTCVTYDGECPDASPFDATRYALWGRMFGGGRMGDIIGRSRELPHLKSPTGAGARVYVHSGMVNQVFGGARAGDIEGGTYVEINDKSHNHFHTIVNRVFGGCDVSGHIGTGLQTPEREKKRARSNTFVRIMETMHEDSTYTGFPLVGEVYAGGNGNYGVGDYNRYTGGYVQMLGADSAALAGRERPNIDSAYVEVLGGTIWDLYGGASNSLVRKNTVISVRYRDGADVPCNFDRVASQDCYRRGRWATEQFRTMFDGYNDDGSQLEANHSIRRVFGGNNHMDMIVQPKWRLRKGNIGHIYGGCNQGDVIFYNEFADRNVHSTDTLIYEGGRQNFASPGIVLDLPWVDLSADNVFGGSRMGNVVASRLVEDAEGNLSRGEAVTFADNQYGVTVQISNGTFGRVFGGNDITGTILNGTHMQISGGLVNEIFGAGNGEYQYEYDPSVERVTEMWDPEQKVRYYKLPALPQFGGDKPTDFQKIQAINFYRPNIAKSFIEIAGGIRSDMTRRMAYVFQGIYCGGNCSTILGPDEETEGQVRLDIGGHLVANNVYLGSNGAPHIEPAYIHSLMQRNGITDLSQEDDEGRTLLDYHMKAVEMHGLPKDFALHRSYTDCFIGSFYVGGNRGSLSTHGPMNISFPRSMVIFNKIVGGSDRAEITYRDPSTGETLIHHGGILYNGTGARPTIHLTVRSQYRDMEMTTDPSKSKTNYLLSRSGNATDFSFVPVYSGCYKSGKVEGVVTAEIAESDAGIQFGTDDDDREGGVFEDSEVPTTGGFFGE